MFEAVTPFRLITPLVAAVAVAMAGCGSEAGSGVSDVTLPEGLELYVSVDAHGPETYEELVAGADVVVVGVVSPVSSRTPLWEPEPELRGTPLAEQERFVSSTTYNAWQSIAVREVLHGELSAKAIELVTHAVDDDHQLVKSGAITFEQRPLGPIKTGTELILVLERYPADSAFAGAYGIHGGQAGLARLDGRRIVDGSLLLRAQGTIDEIATG